MNIFSSSVQCFTKTCARLSALDSLLWKCVIEFFFCWFSFGSRTNHHTTSLDTLVLDTHFLTLSTNKVFAEECFCIWIKSGRSQSHQNLSRWICYRICDLKKMNANCSRFPETNLKLFCFFCNNFVYLHRLTTEMLRVKYNCFFNVLQRDQSK